MKLQIEIGILPNAVHSLTNSTFPEVFNMYSLCLVPVSTGFDTSAVTTRLPNRGENNK